MLESLPRNCGEKVRDAAGFSNRKALLKQSWPANRFQTIPGHGGKGSATHPSPIG
jgi:hypothetical protein